MRKCQSSCSKLVNRNFFSRTCLLDVSGKLKINMHLCQMTRSDDKASRHGISQRASNAQLAQVKNIFLVQYCVRLPALAACAETYFPLIDCVQLKRKFHAKVHTQKTFFAILSFSRETVVGPPLHSHKARQQVARKHQAQLIALRDQASICKGSFFGRRFLSWALF